MVTKVVIRDNQKSPLKYINDLDKFKNGSEFVFKDGINIIVGENGSGKTTLLKLIESYLLVGYNEVERGTYSVNINKLIGFDNTFLDGIDVYADYDKNVFRLSHSGEREKHKDVNTFEQFETMFNQMNSSTGEGVLEAINQLFTLMFSHKVRLNIDYEDLIKFDNERPYLEYINKHKVDCPNSFTIIMDEPDRNLSLKNINEVISILSYEKENTQLIAVVHNPLIIYNLSKNENINFIEMTDGYVNKVKSVVNELIS